MCLSGTCREMHLWAQGSPWVQQLRACEPPHLGWGRVGRAALLSGMRAEPQGVPRAEAMVRGGEGGPE